jgi:hypothetical protein
VTTLLCRFGLDWLAILLHSNKSIPPVNINKGIPMLRGNMSILVFELALSCDG